MIEYLPAKLMALRTQLLYAQLGDFCTYALDFTYRALVDHSQVDEMLNILQGAYKRTKTVAKEHAVMQALRKDMTESKDSI